MPRPDLEPPTVVMVHGAFCGGWAFDGFREPFEAAGWRVLAPDLPGHGAGAQTTDVAGRSMSDYAAAIAELCRAQASPPVLLGHSMGGLVCQMAARRAPIAALMLLAPSPPWGLSGGTLEEAAAAFGVAVADPFWTGALPPDRAMMRAHGLDRATKSEQTRALARLGPESGRAVREALNWWLDPFMTTSIGPGVLPIPSLSIVGGRDRIHPPGTVRQVAIRIGGAYREMPAMGHWLIAEPETGEVTRLCLAWLAERGFSAAPQPSG